MNPEWNLKGWHVLTAALSFFGLVIGANAIMVSFALSTFSGADTDDAYRKGLSYNDTLAQRAEAAEAKWSAQTEVERGDSGSADVVVRLARQGETVSGMTVIAALRHPADARRDRSIVLSDGGNGRYTGTFDAIPRGNWEIAVAVSGGGRAILETRQRTWLP